MRPFVCESQPPPFGDNQHRLLLRPRRCGSSARRCSRPELAQIVDGTTRVTVRGAEGQRSHLPHGVALLELFAHHILDTAIG